MTLSTRQRSWAAGFGVAAITITFHYALGDTSALSFLAVMVGRLVYDGDLS